MTNAEIIGIIENEIQCVQRADSGCDRKCDTCDLVMDTKTILEAYNIIIDILSKSED